MPELSIIILNYNTSKLLKSCLNSIFSANIKTPFEVIVVDNNSSDDSVYMLQKTFPEVQLVKSRENLGYARGNNEGLKNAKGDFFLFLNSDTEVVGGGIDLMIEWLRKNPKSGILGPKLVYQNQSVQFSVGKFYSPVNVFLMLFGFERLGLLRSSPEKECIVDWVSGASILIRKTVFEKIGTFDENLFMYMDEVEFCYRAKLFGIKTGFIPKAVFIHKERGSSESGKEKPIINIYIGLLYFYKKYFKDYQLFLKILLKIKAFTAWQLGKIFYRRDLVSIYEKAYKLVK